MTDTLRDRIAEAIYEGASGWEDYPFDQLTASIKAMFLEQADAVIAALALREDKVGSLTRYVTEWTGR